MNAWSRLSIFVSLTLYAASSWAQSEPLNAKQLAGPPEEIPTMQAADPSEGMVFSRSALLPIEFDKAGNWEGSVPVEQGKLKFSLLTPQPARKVAMTSPSGQALSAAVMARNAEQLPISAEMPEAKGTHYEFDNVATGSWKLQLQGEPGERGFIAILGDENIALGSYQAYSNRTLGQSFVVRSVVEDAAAGNALARVGLQMDQVTLRVTDESERHHDYPMHDDGQHDDGNANDGVYAAAFKPDRSGTYRTQVIAHGRNAKGVPIMRSTADLIAVVESSLRLAAGGATALPAPGNRLALSVPLANRDPGQHYRVMAEVWGANDVPVAWVGGMVMPEDGRLDIGFDPRWIKRSGARAPFELRNLRIEDPDHFVTLASAQRIPLAIGKLPVVSAASIKQLQNSEPDETMLYGPRPSPSGNLYATGNGSLAASGRGLLLVHGYCSNRVWPVADFTGEIVFSDTQKNRSIDHFARIIRSQGDSVRHSYGIVAHSQGGMAALHLAAWYWSGLDNAYGGRLIQSVGTPYQGTPAAGMLAAIGGLFGTGCGANDNLTEAGATRWLAGISYRQRAKVTFHTTSSPQEIGRPGYCSPLDAFALRQPSDGLVEKYRAQLPGANANDHREGWCHTEGFGWGWTAQFRDRIRNNWMNGAASR